MLKLFKKILKNILPYYLFKKWQKHKERKHLFSDAKCKRLNNDDRLLEIVRTDCKHPFFLRDKTMDLGTYWQIFVNKEYVFNANKIPNVIVDAGANIGLSAIYFANKFPSTKIIAIEPELENFKLLKKNSEKYENIIPLHSALWNNIEEIDIIDNKLGTNAYMAVKNDSTKGGYTVANKVNTTTIVTILDNYNLDYIDILKIDIEGSEKEIFENSDTWIGKINAIIIELHDRMKTGCSRIFYNKTNGFSDEWIHGENIYLSRDKFIEECKEVTL